MYWGACPSRVNKPILTHTLVTTRYGRTEHLGIKSPEMISSGQGSSTRRAAERASERRRHAPTAMRMAPSQTNTGSEQPEPGPSA
eukprot:4697802-Prymnesium_polylepis.1